MGQASHKHKDEKGATGDGQHEISKQTVAVGPSLYPGQACTYYFVNFAAVRQSLSGAVYMSNNTLSTTNPDNYMPRLAELYTEGYRLLSFVVKPGNLTATFFAKGLTSDISCQAICRKVGEEECYETYSIKHEKSALPSQAFLSGCFQIQGTASNIDHIFQIIGDETASGSRLVCVEVTGFSQFLTGTATLGHHSHHEQYHGNLHLMPNAPSTAVDSVFGVDIFFEVPQFAGASKYIYQCVPVQMNLVTLYTNSALSFDWFPVVKSYCETGWRLVEVFFDQRSQVTVQNSFYERQNIHGGQQVVNSGVIFIFEKEESKIDDNIPVYEVTVVEFGAKVKSKSVFGGVTVEMECSWEDTVASMGVEGWELVRILFTPLMDLKGYGFASIKQERKLLIFLQREIMPPPARSIQSGGKVDVPSKPGTEVSGPDEGTDSASSDPPPPYSTIVQDAEFQQPDPQKS